MSTRTTQNELFRPDSLRGNGQSRLSDVDLDTLSCFKYRVLNPPSGELEPGIKRRLSALIRACARCEIRGETAE
jgi:hypothetical protein